MLEELAGAQRPANVKRPRRLLGEQGRGRLQLERIGGLLEPRRPKPLGGMVRAQTITVRTTPDVGNPGRL